MVIGVNRYIHDTIETSDRTIYPVVNYATSTTAKSSQKSWSRFFDRIRTSDEN